MSPNLFPDDREPRRRGLTPEEARRATDDTHRTDRRPTTRKLPFGSIRVFWKGQLGAGDESPEGWTWGIGSFQASEVYPTKAEAQIGALAGAKRLLSEALHSL